MGELKVKESNRLELIRQNLDKCGVYCEVNNDNLFIESLMKPVSDPGKYADWISAPDVGIDNKPGDFEYVKIHDA